MEISENLNDKIKKLTNHEKVVTKYYGGINILKNIQKKGFPKIYTAETGSIQSVHSQKQQKLLRRKTGYKLVSKAAKIEEEILEQKIPATGLEERKQNVTTSLIERLKIELLEMPLTSPIRKKATVEDQEKNNATIQIEMSLKK